MTGQRRRIQKSLGVSAILVIVGIVVFMVFSSYELPEYNGKTIDEWFYGEHGHPGRETTLKDAEVVFKEMGTNCVPYLIEKAQTTETILSRIYAKGYPRLPETFRQRLKPPLKGAYIQLVALRHLRSLHVSQLEPYADQLMELVPEISDNQNRFTAFGIVDHVVIRSDSLDAKTNFFLSFLNDSNFQLRMKAAVTLANVDATLTNGIPTFVNALTNDSLMRAAYKPPRQLSMRYGLQPNLQVKLAREEALRALESVAPELAEEFEVRELDEGKEPVP